MEKTSKDAQEVKPTNVYEAISRVQAELAKTGISKDRNNEQQKFKFRGIDDVYNALAGLLAENGLCILPRVLKREVTERKTVKTFGNETKESVLFYVAVEVEFDFVLASRPDSKHTVKTFGEAMDSGDKATNKAMSAAYKYACLQTFCIPTEGDNDADATTHEVIATPPPVFDSPQVRGMFVANWLESIERAESTKTLDDLKALDQAKLNAMKKSADKDDVAAFDRIVAAYKPKYEELEKLEKATAKPKTVESIVAAVGDDSIKY